MKEVEIGIQYTIAISSQKFSRAEPKKQQLENNQLIARYKLSDKQTVRINNEIDREKRTVRKMCNVAIKTSGASDCNKEEVFKAPYIHTRSSIKHLKTNW